MTDKLMLFSEREVVLIVMQVGCVVVQIVNVQNGKARIAAKWSSMLMKECVSNIGDL